MRKPALLLVALVLCVGCVAVTSGAAPGKCVLSATTEPLWVSPTPTCPAGYYCPHMNVSDPTTYPVICPPTPECRTARLFGSFCDAQGTYEPTVCLDGFYCPTFDQQLDCPEGSYCPLGSTSPIPCGPLTDCPTGSNKRMFYGPAVVLVVIDIVIVVAVSVSKWRANRRAHDARTRRRAADSAIQAKESTSLLGHRHVVSSTIVEACSSNTSASTSTSTNAVGADLEAQDLRLSIEFQDLNYRLGSGFHVLHNVWGRVSSGRLTAIMGPSGAGKTALLSALMGKVPGVTGTILVNNSAQDIRKYRKVLGFVPQEDVMHRQLTVHEILLHAARVGLPAAWSAQKVEKYVEALIAVLGLTGVEGVIGDEISRGISGGERKRVNIGMELAAAPLLLGLDEPTSGLDSASALAVCTLLKDLSSLGLSVVAVIHQPRREIFDILDDIILLSSTGRVVYSGPRDQVIEQLRHQGFVWSGQGNPADFLLDVASGIVHSAAGAVSAAPVPQAATTPNMQLLSSHHSARVPQTRVTANLVWQTMWGTWRSLLLQYRMFSTLVVELFLASLAGALMGSTVAMGDRMYSGVLKGVYSLMSPAPDEQSIPLLAFFINMAVGVATSPSAVRVFGDDIAVYWRESASGHSRSAQFLSRTLSVLLRITLSAGHFVCGMYMLAQPRGSFFNYFLVIWMIAFCTYGIGGAMSIIASRTNPSLVAVIVSLAVASMCGFSPTLAQVQQWGIMFIWDCSPATHAAQAIMGTELQPWAALFDIDATSKDFGYALDTFWSDMGWMLGIGIVLRIITFGLLIFTNRRKQR